MSESRIGVVTATSLNLRADPSTSKAPIGSLPRGSEVRILQQVDGWYKVSKGDRIGYVYGDFLQVKEAQVTGFLSDMSNLHSAPMSPPEGARIAVTSAMSARARGVGRTWNAQGGLLSLLSNVLDIHPGAAVAVLCVESGGRGFNQDGSMVIRFENHVFWRGWGKNNPEKFSSHFRFNAEAGWKGHEFRDNARGRWRSFHGVQSEEWKVLSFARNLDEVAALRSISMGTPQIMGFNHARIGYDSVRLMFEAFSSSLRMQTLGLFDFIKGPDPTSPMITALQRQKFGDFAALYNGPGQTVKYGDLIEQHFSLFSELQGT